MFLPYISLKIGRNSTGATMSHLRKARKSDFSWGFGLLYNTCEELVGESPQRFLSRCPKITWGFLVPKLQFGNEKSGNLFLDSY
jgi:hypothetical protein